MPTVTIQIGNSDDKLTQREWSDYVTDVQFAIQNHGGDVHFSGGSPTDEVWQNFCFVCNVSRPRDVDGLKQALRAVRLRFRQDSAAMTVGETVFV